MQSAFRRATEHGEIPAGPTQGTYEISLARGSTAALPPAAPGNAGHGAACGRPIRTLTQIGSTDKIVPRRMLLDSRLASFGHCGWKVVVMREAELGQRSHTRQCLTCKNKGCIGHCRFAKPIPKRAPMPLRGVPDKATTLPRLAYPISFTQTVLERLTVKPQSGRETDDRI